MRNKCLLGLGLVFVISLTSMVTKYRENDRSTV